MHFTQPPRALRNDLYLLKRHCERRVISPLNVRSCNITSQIWGHSYATKPSFRHMQPFSQLSSTRPLHLFRKPRVPYRHQHQRIHVPTVLIPPFVFTGLFLALWTWKCLMMVVFQNKIIYMPSMPPFSRSESIVDYEQQCKPVEWREERIRSADGTEIALAVGSAPSPASIEAGRQLVVLYFQG